MLQTCPQCGAEAASTRRTCPLCGTSLRRPSPWVPMLGALALLALVALGAVLVWAARPLYQDATRHADRVRTAQGTVIQVARHETTDSVGRPLFVYSPKIVFRGVGGMQTFEATTHQRLEAGQAVTVYFDPDNLAQASLNPPTPGAPLSRLIGFAASGLLLIVTGCGGLAGVARHLLKVPRTTAARSDQ
jgi:uncharacterized protein DUF3592